MEQDKRLFRTSPDAYGPDYKDHLLEQYKLYVESTSQISERRTSANNYLVTVNAFLVTLYGLASSFGNNTAWLVVVPVSGALVCVTWLALIRSYRDLNTAKFKVLHELEQRLPAALFDREWDHAQQGEGKAYKPLTHIEPYIPLVFASLYIILAIHAIAASGSPPGGQAGENAIEVPHDSIRRDQKQYNPNRSSLASTPLAIVKRSTATHSQYLRTARVVESTLASVVGDERNHAPAKNQERCVPRAEADAMVTEQLPLIEVSPCLLGHAATGSGEPGSRVMKRQMSGHYLAQDLQLSLHLSRTGQIRSAA